MKLFIVYTPGIFGVPHSHAAFLTANDAQEEVERRNGSSVRETEGTMRVGDRWYWRSVRIGEDFVTGSLPPSDVADRADLAGWAPRGLWKS